MTGERHRKSRSGDRAPESGLPPAGARPPGSGPGQPGSRPPGSHPAPRTKTSSQGATPAADAADGGVQPRESAPSASPPSEEQERVERDLSDLLADVERERDEYLELARRTKADFENYRKRVAGETAQAEKRARADLVRQLLPVLDNLERALESETAGPRGDERVSNPLAEGVRLVYEELKGVLERSGVESYEPAGETFDPELHEAMMTRPAPSDQAGKVLEVLEKGYRQDGQVLRAARVIVGAPPQGDEPAAGEAEEG